MYHRMSTIIWSKMCGRFSQIIYLIVIVWYHCFGYPRDLSRVFVTSCTLNRIGEGNMLTNLHAAGQFLHLQLMQVIHGCTQHKLSSQHFNVQQCMHDQMNSSKSHIIDYFAAFQISISSTHFEQYWYSGRP